MKIGDLIKHKRNGVRGLIVDVFEAALGDIICYIYWLDEWESKTNHFENELELVSAIKQT